MWTSPGKIIRQPEEVFVESNWPPVRLRNNTITPYPVKCYYFVFLYLFYIPSAFSNYYRV